MIIASYEDPMKKREDFAVSLRKKKTHDLISAKRRKLMTASKSHVQDEISKEEEKTGARSAITTSVMNTVYKGYLPFERDSESYEKILSELCPEANTLAGPTTHQQELSLSRIVELT